MNKAVTRGATQMVAAASLLVLLAAAVILVAVYDAKWYIGLYAVLIGMGIVLIALSFVPSGSGSCGRSTSDMRLVWGVLIAMIGLIGIVNAYVSGELWVAAVMVLLTIAVLVMILMMKGLIRAKG